MKRTKVSTKMVKTYVGMIQKYRNKGIYYTVKLSHGPHARVLHHIPTCFNRFNTLMVTMVTINKQTNHRYCAVAQEQACPLASQGFLDMKPTQEAIRKTALMIAAIFGVLHNSILLLHYTYVAIGDHAV